jgi:hypothetical protein
MSDEALAVPARRIGALEWVRLWFSYQRYGFLLVGSAVALPLGAWIGLHSWWLMAIAVLLALPAFIFGMNALARWPEKVRATKLADRRIAAGRFDPLDVRPFCGDPCFRVVANELLRRASVPRCERRRVIAELRAQVDRENNMGVMIDHTRGIVTVVEGGQATHYRSDELRSDADHPASLRDARSLVDSAPVLGKIQGPQNG